MSGPGWGESGEDRWSRSERWRSDAGAYRELDEGTNGRRWQEDRGFGGQVVSLLLCLVGAPVARWLGHVTHRPGFGWEALYFMGFVGVAIGLGYVVRALWDRL
ncbi:hypothetical protein AB0M29_12355 [Streptomyces sp. NPDC051976]|uniref:hypothetical protein n=1 Tax=Streptomyces sp. NPDC051976 TaxID=3154947 RepID=UPI003448BABD